MNRRSSVSPASASAAAAVEAAPSAPAAERRPVRERLLASADELFYREGINNVGIDRVLEHAGVAKASLYSTYGSKDELVRAYLEARHQLRVARVEARMALHAAPRDKLLAVFDSMAELAATPGFRGCAFMKASAELPANERTQPVCETYRGWLRDLFLRLVREAGVPHPAPLVQQIVLLYDGAAVAAQMDGDASAAKAARATVAMLLDAAIAATKKKR
jgi:AcrR family transcriptional regulator